VFGFDYLFITKSLKVVRSLSEGDELLLKILVATVSTGKAAFAHTVDVKGPGEDRYAVQRLAEDICWLGYTRVLLRSDNEPAILKLMEGSLKSLRVGVVEAGPPGAEEPSEEMRHYHEQVGQEHPPVYDSNANGEVENAIRRCSGLLRTVKLCLEKRLQQRVPTDHKVMSWLVEHVAWILTTRACEQDGITAYHRIKGKEYVKRTAGFG
jgi:hypothetical protein